MRLIAFILCCTLAGTFSVRAVDANRLTYLDEFNPFHPGLHFPKLTTPQWLGEPEVEAVVTLGIDDLRGNAPRYEEFLRPILERLKQEDGRAPVSIFSNSIEVDDPQFPRWLEEGLSLEVHTLHHPCPILAKGNFEAAWNTFHGGVELLNLVPGNKPVAFRTPCCDSINSASPRLFAEIFNGASSAGQFLAMDSSVFHFFTSEDEALPRELALDKDGGEKFLKYHPFPSFTTIIYNYPYPYVLGGLIWEFPCMAPSDWQAQHLHGEQNALTLEDWKSALEATVLKQGTFNLVFHPYDWIRNTQVLELVEHAFEKHGGKVKFLNFREAHDRLTEHLLAGHPLRAANGQDNGVRLIDLNNNGYLDVIIANESARLTRIWDPEQRRWQAAPFPVPLVAIDEEGNRKETGVRFGVLRPDGHASFMVRNEHSSGAWHFDGGQWIEDHDLFNGLELDGRVLFTSHQFRDRGVRFRDVTGNNQCELIVSNETQNQIFTWSPKEKQWTPLPYSLPRGVSLVDAEGRDNGLRFVDLNQNGHADIIFSNAERYSAHVFMPQPLLGWGTGWTRLLLEGKRGEEGELPMIVRDGPHRNNGVWFHSGHLWAQNEDTAHLPNHVDRRLFDDLLVGVQAPSLPPEESLASIQAPEGFIIELVAHEPMVKDPVAFEWGPDGRFWVVEMGDYPLGLDGKGRPGGRVRFLEDTTGDGRYDRSTVFLEKLNFPTGVFPWRDGVLISAAPDILHAEDTTGDGRADKVEVLFSGFGEGNHQHRVNGFVYGLDNWIHGANGDSGGNILSLRTGKQVSISGRDFRFHPESGLFEAQEGQTQFGRNRDDWGNWFGNANYAWGWHYVLPERYVARNPQLPVRNLRHNIAPHPADGLIHVISPPQQRLNVVGAHNHVTAACSLNPYRDELFGPEFENNIFISDPAFNVIHRRVLIPEGVTFDSRRAEGEEDREFIASTDNWFRPTMVKTGPDGALYFADMYRLIIEHPEYAPEDLRARLNLRAGEDLGRLYRIYPKQAQPRPVPKLDQLSPIELVALLESPNGWQRDTAQRLLVDAQERAAIPPLRKLAVQHPSAKTRLQSLSTLEGIGGLTPELLAQAFADPDRQVRRHALRLSELILQQNQPLPAPFTEAFLALVNDSAPVVRFQLAFTLGEWNAAEAAQALLTLAKQDGGDRYFRTAVLSSTPPHLKNLLGQLGAVEAGRAPELPPEWLLEHLFTLAVAQGEYAALAGGLMAALRPDAPRHFSFNLLAALLEALETKGISFQEFQRGSQRELKTLASRKEGAVAEARRIVQDEQAELPLRLAAVRLLGRGERPQDDLVQLAKLLEPQQPQPLQQASLAVIRRHRAPQLATHLVGQWEQYSPAARLEVLDALFARTEWLRILLNALERQEIEPQEIPASHRQRLLSHKEENVRRSAGKLFSIIASDRQEVIDRYAGLSLLTGDRINGGRLYQQLCAQCHRTEEIGTAIGPDLVSMHDKSIDFLLVEILDPNRSVDPKFVSYNIRTAVGAELSGIITSESANSLTIRTAAGAEETLLRSDIASLSSSRLSLMPEGLEESLPPQAMADLIAYLRNGSAQ